MHKEKVTQLMQAAGLDRSQAQAAQRFAALLEQALQAEAKPDRQANAPSFELYEAVVSAPHEIDSQRIVLHHDERQPGHNAANQLMRRLQDCQARQALAHAQERERLLERIQELEEQLYAVGAGGVGQPVRSSNRTQPVAWMYRGVRADGSPHDHPKLILNPRHMDALSADRGVNAIPLVVGTEPAAEPVAWSTGVKDDRVMFKVGVQAFTLAYEPEDEVGCSAARQREWMRAQLEHALSQLAAQPVQPESLSLTREELRATFAQAYPKDAAILEQLESQQSFLPGALGARHHWAAFEQGARAARRAS